MQVIIQCHPLLEPGNRRYQDYSDEHLQECLQRIRSGDLSTRAAAMKYNIPRSTLMNKLKDKHPKPVGRPAVATVEEEIKKEKDYTQFWH